MNIILIILLLLMPFQVEETFTVSGQIMFENQAPYPGAFELRLCVVIGDGLMCALDVEPPGPRAEYDEDGFFEFEGIPNGTYGLVLYMSYFSQVLAWWPDGSSEAMFTIDGANVDIGTLSYDDCPSELFQCQGRIAFLPIVLRQE